MGDKSPIRTLGDYFKPSHEGYRNTIKLPHRWVINVYLLITPSVGRKLNALFHGLRSEDPNQHLKDFLKLVDSLDLDGENRERTRLRLFQFSLRDQASNWLERLPAGSITTWEDLTTRFLAQFFPPGRTAKLRNDILMFQQHHGESLSEAWTRFKDLLQKVPHHGIDLWLQDLALYDNESWNDPRDFAKPVKAIALPQDVPMNKVTTSCEICSGPHDTQYCMEDPEQAFVEYASSSTDEAGGPNLNDDGIEWLDVEEPLDLDKKGDPRNLKIPYMIGHRFTANAYIDVDLPMDIMSLAYYNSIRKNGYEYMGRNFLGLGKDMHVVVGNMSYVMDLTILESIEANIDPSLSNIVFGRPFVEIACLAINRKYGLMTFARWFKEIAFKTPYKDPKRSELSGKGHDLLSSRVVLNEDDYDRGCRKPSDLEDGFYRDISKLGPEYLTKMDDEGEVT
ncbi:protein kinase-like domain, concanavalin A-like lectin/glucanase domain protein [Tanacetum coccineum]